MQIQSAKSASALFVFLFLALFLTAQPALAGAGQAREQAEAGLMHLHGSVLGGVDPDSPTVLPDYMTVEESLATGHLVLALGQDVALVCSGGTSELAAKAFTVADIGLTVAEGKVKEVKAFLEKDAPGVLKAKAQTGAEALISFVPVARTVYSAGKLAWVSGLDKRNRLAELSQRGERMLKSLRANELSREVKKLQALIAKVDNTSKRMEYKRVMLKMLQRKALLAAYAQTLDEYITQKVQEFGRDSNLWVQQNSQGTLIPCQNDYAYALRDFLYENISRETFRQRLGDIISRCGGGGFMGGLRDQQVDQVMQFVSGCKENLARNLAQANKPVTFTTYDQLELAFDGDEVSAHLEPAPNPIVAQANDALLRELARNLGFSALEEMLKMPTQGMILSVVDQLKPVGGRNAYTTSLIRTKEYRETRLGLLTAAQGDSISAICGCSLGSKPVLPSIKVSRLVPNSAGGDDWKLVEEVRLDPDQKPYPGEFYLIPNWLHTFQNQGRYRIECGDAKLLTRDRPVDLYVLPADHLTEKKPPAPDHSIILVVDSSGSMKESDPKGLRKSALAMMADQLGQGFQLGVVTFNQKSKQLTPLTNMGAFQSPARRGFKNRLQRIGAEGGTNITAGLNRAAAMIKDPAHTELVLFSDGKDDKWQGRVNMLPKGVRVHTVALSKKADTASLAKASRLTGGVHEVADRGDDLQRIFNNIFGQSTKTELVSIVEKMLKTGQVINAPVFLGRELSEVIFSTAWPGSSVDMSLINPAGKVLTLDQAVQKGMAVKAATYNLIKVPNPMPGQWQVRVKGVQLDPGGERVAMRVSSAKSLLQTSWRLGKSQPKTGQSCGLIMTSRGAKVDWQQAEVTLRLPGGRVRRFESGLGQSQTADGLTIWSHVFENPGVHRITARVRGVMGSENIERSFDRSFEVGKGKAQPPVQKPKSQPRPEVKPKPRPEDKGGRRYFIVE